MRKFIRNLAFSCGSFSSGIITIIFSSWLMFFYVDTLKFDASAIGIALTISAVWNAICNPLAGYISDRTRSKWGRRKPYVLFCTLPLFCIFVLLWMPPLTLITGSLARLVYFTAIVCIYDAFFTIVLLNWVSIIPEMYLEDADRSALLGLTTVLGILGALLASVAVQPVIEAYGWTTMAVIYGIIGCVMMYISLFGMKENAINQTQKPLGFIKYFAYTFSNKIFILVVFSMLFVECAKGITTAMLPFFTKYAYQLNNGVSIMEGTLFVAAILFTPLTLHISKKLGVKSTYIICILVFGGAVSILYFVFSLITLLITCVAIGFGVSGIMIFPDVFYSQIIDEDQLKTKVRREGAYFGSNALIIRFSTAIQSLIMGFVLKSSGYNSNLTVQSSGSITGIRILTSFVPLIFIILGLALIAFYPLHGKRLEEISRRVKEIYESEKDEASITAYEESHL